MFASCLAGAGLAAGPVVRRRVAASAQAAHLAVEVERVRLGFFVVRLEGVRVAPEGEQGVSVAIPEVRVTLSAGLTPTRVVATRPVIALDGDVGELRAMHARWRARRSPSSGASGAAERALIVEDATVRWRSAEGALEVTGGHLTVAEGAFVARADLARLQRPREPGADGVALEVRGALVELEGGRVFRSARADSVRIELDRPPRAAGPTTAPSALAPPALPTASEEKKSSHSKQVEAPLEPFSPLPLPDLAVGRARLSVVTRALAEVLPAGAELRTAALSLEVRGDSPVSVGPGPFAFVRHPDALHVSFKSGGAATSPPMSLELHAPLGVGETSLTVDGGPLPLSLLGLREGALGLVDVARATAMAKGRLVLDAPGTSVTFDGEVQLANASLRQPRLSRETLRGLSVAVGGRGLLTSSSLRLDDGRVVVGAARLDLRGSMEQDPAHLQAHLAFDLPTVGCRELAEGVPSGLLPTVRDVRFAGTLTARGRLAFDTKNLDALELDYTIDDRCRATEVPSALSRERFKGAFTHAIVHPDGTRGEATTGPGSGNWTELGGISPFLVVAVTTTEDGSFFRHHGFNHGAIKQSVVANVKARRFVRGASTITMQLAKNLFLVREKTLSRKLEELVLADYLEQVFRKEELMELYLNVVEFGPDIYGVTQAAAHYFGRAPLELNLSECLFLASVLPSPVRSHRLAEHGELPEHWQRHLQSLMRIAERTHRITPAELEAGLQERVVFHRPGAPRPPPRTGLRPTGVGAEEGDERDPAWRRLD